MASHKHVLSFGTEVGLHGIINVTRLKPRSLVFLMQSQKVQTAMDPVESEYYDLGSYQRPVTARNDEARIWFNRGLIWCYGFNHEEAADCFEKAIEYDSKCALAYWGLAYALGPNYNKPWEFFDEEELERTVQRTHAAVTKAEECADTATPVERSLAHALHARYPQKHAREDCSIWNIEYANAMEKVYQQFPDDLDVATLCADALMNLTPWELWDLKTGQPAENARTMTVKNILDQAMAQEGGMQHAGVLHLYIHLMEMSPTPEAAGLAADMLRGLVPDSGHLNHMPTHIDVLVGAYTNGVQSNQMAIDNDEKFLARAGAINFYTTYRTHDFHFCIYSAMFAGQSKVALDTVARLEQTIPEQLLRVQSPPMADWLEGFLSMRVHVLVRFGRWQDIIDLPMPHDATLYCVGTAMLHYAKAVAYAATGNIEEAEFESKDFKSAQLLVPESRRLFNNKCTDILKVADAMIRGELLYRRGDYDPAFAELRRSILLYDALPYDEPWGWMQPTRHAYGALLMEQRHFELAIQAYADDLGIGINGQASSLPRALQHRGNVWALHGYHECLLKLGRVEEAKAMEPQLRKALDGADVEIKASCFCRGARLKEKI